MDHVEGAGDRGNVDTVLHCALADPVGEFGFDAVGQAGQSGAGEVELHTMQPVLGHGSEDLLHSRACECFGEDAEEHGAISKLKAQKKSQSESSRSKRSSRRTSAGGSSLEMLLRFELPSD